MNRRTRKTILILSLVVVLLTGCALAPSSEQRPTTGFCTVSAEVDEACGSDAGSILEPVDVPVSDGDTVLDVLLHAVADVNPEHGSENVRVIGSAYVSGIGNDSMDDLLYEKDMGPQSGWLFYVNGAYVDVGASRKTVQTGDVITWVYRCTPEEVGG